MGQGQCSRSYTDRTLKRLFALSGNQCANAECNLRLIDGAANHSQICHIEALNSEGLRFNADLDYKERNDYDNLILLCPNHHSIIDSANEDGLPAFSVDELKSMKQEHEDSVREQQEYSQISTPHSILSEIVRDLIALQNSSPIDRRPAPFAIEAKIASNDVNRWKAFIEKYAAYLPDLQDLYDELETGQLHAFLETVNDCYLTENKASRSADEILDAVQSHLLGRLIEERNRHYTEQLEWSLRIIIVDGFTRCKILEDPTS